MTSRRRRRAIPDGTGDLPDASVSTSGTLAGLNFGVDGPGDIVLSTSGNIGFNTLAGNPIATVWDLATHTLTGEDSVTLSTVFTLQITNVATGAYTFTLLAPVQHTVAGTEDDKTFNVTATVTDVEGDSATGTISVLIDDDTPVAANDGQLASVDDDASNVVIGTVAGLLSNDSYGEDGQRFSEHHHRHWQPGWHGDDQRRQSSVHVGDGHRFAVYAAGGDLHLHDQGRRRRHHDGDVHGATDR